jgi:hypothetical protein
VEPAAVFLLEAAGREIAGLGQRQHVFGRAGDGVAVTADQPPCTISFMVVSWPCSLYAQIVGTDSFVDLC